MAASRVSPAAKVPSTTGRAASSLVRGPRPGLDANALEWLAHVLACKSFAQAGRELGLTRAAVSRRVAQIEQQLGEPLFARSTRALGLTEAGRRLAVRAGAVKDAAEQARRALRGRRVATGGLAGTLRITAMPSLGPVIAPVLAQFQARHPGVKLELLVTHRRVDLVRDDVDLAFRVTRQVPPDWVAHPMMDFVVHAYARARRGIPLASPAALEREGVLLFGAPIDALPMRWQHATRGDVIVQVRPTCCADDFGTLMALARAGNGIVFAPDYCVAEALARGELVDALPGWCFQPAEGNSVVALTLPYDETPHSALELLRMMRGSRLGGEPAARGRARPDARSSA